MVEMVEGVMQRVSTSITIALVFFSMTGCTIKADAVRTRAAFDLSCPETELQVTPLTSEIMDTATYGVTGCGKKASYIYTPNAGAVLNSEIQEQPK